MRAQERRQASASAKFLILTNVRTDAVLKATWDQFALDQAVWTVPLVNLKDRKHRTEGFRVPLVERAVEIVRQMRQGRVSQFVFPGQAHGKPLSNMAPWIPERSATRLGETDLNVLSKLGKQGLEWRLEPEAFTGGEVRREDDLLDFLVGCAVDIEVARQPST